MNTNIPTTDFSPVFSAFNVYQRAKQNLNQEDPLGVIAKTAVGIGGVLWDWKQKDDVNHAQDHARGIQEEFDQLQRLAALGPSNKDESGNQGISAEEFQQSVGVLKQKLGTFQYQTPAGKAVIDDYAATGFSQDLDAMVRQVGPILAKRNAKIAEDTLYSQAQKDTGDSESYASQISALDSSMTAAKKAEAQSQIELSAASAEEAAAGKNLSDIQAYQTTNGQGNEGLNQDVAASLESATSTQSEKAKARADAEAKAASASEASKASTAAYETAKTTGTDGYKAWAREYIKSTGLARPEQVEDEVNRWVGVRDNLIYQKIINAGLKDNRFDDVQEYIDAKLTGEAHDAAMKTRDAQYEQFWRGRNQFWLEQATAGSVWYNPIALQQKRNDISNEGHNKEFLGTLQDYGAHAAPEKEKLLKTIDDQLAWMHSHTDDDQKTKINEGWKIVEGTKGRHGEDQEISMQSANATILQMMGNNEIPALEATKMFDTMEQYALGDNNPKLQGYFKIWTTWKDGFVSENGKAKPTDNGYIQRANRASFMGDELRRKLQENPGMFDADAQKLIKDSQVSIFSQDAIDTLNGFEKTVTRPGLFQPSVEEQRSKKYSLAEKGKLDPYVNYNGRTGKLEILPEAKAAYEDMLQSTNNAFQNTEFNGKKYTVGTDATPVPMEDGTIIYVVKGDGGKPQIVYTKSNAKAPGGVEFSGSTHSVFSNKAAEIADKINKETVYMDQARAWKAELDDAKKSAQFLSENERQTYDSLKQMLDKIEKADNKYGTKYDPLGDLGKRLGK